MSSSIEELPPASETKGDVRISPLAGRPAAREWLVGLSGLEREYFRQQPDVEDATQLRNFGTSGHQGSSLEGTFTEAHVLAIAQAICDYRRNQGTDGPLCIGKDTHALSGPAQRTALEVLAANHVDTVIQQGGGATPGGRDRCTNGQGPGEHYLELTMQFGVPYYTRIDAVATPEQKSRLLRLSPADIKESSLAAEAVISKLTHAPGNDAAIGGLKIVATIGWFAARPSGTESIYKIYAESLKSEFHLDMIVTEAQEIVNNGLMQSV